jgi:PKD repeat protein
MPASFGRRVWPALLLVALATTLGSAVSTPLTTFSSAATAWSSQRKIVKATTGTYALLYQKGRTDVATAKGLMLAVSRDRGASWTDLLQIFDSSSASADAVIAPSNDIYLVYSKTDSGAATNNDVVFVKLAYQPASDDWVVVQQTTVYDGTSLVGGAYGSIALENGRLWIALRAYEAGAYVSYVRASSDEGVTWQPALQLEPPNAIGETSAVVHYGDKIGVAYYYNKTALRWRWRYDGDPITVWQPVSTIATLSSGLGDKAGYSLLGSPSGQVDLLYWAGGIKHQRYDGAAWSAPFVLSSTGLHPSLSSNGEDLWATWQAKVPGSSTLTQVVTRRTSGPLLAWEAVDTALSDTLYAHGNATSTAVDEEGPLVAWRTGATPAYINSAAIDAPAGPVNQPPLAAISASATSGTVPLTVAFTAVASDPDGSIASYAWTFGDGSTASTSSASRTYSTAGTYIVTLTVTDDDGATASASATITVHAPPQVSITATPTSGAPPLAVAFTSSVVVSGGGTATYNWTFGDGGTATTPSATHTYASAGSYLARLTVTDVYGGTGSATATISATSSAPPPPPPPPPPSGGGLGGTLPTSSSSPTVWPTQRKILKAAGGAYLLFYQKGRLDPVRGLVMALSRDRGASWTEALQIHGSSSDVSDAVLAASNHVYMVYAKSDSGADTDVDVVFVKLAYDSASKTWSIARRVTVFDGTATTAGTYATIALENGRIWVACRTNLAGVYSTRVYVSSDDGVTWLQSIQVEPTNANSSAEIASLVRFGSRLGVVYYFNKAEMRWRWRNDADPIGVWQPPATIAALGGSLGDKAGFSVLADPIGQVHLLYPRKGINYVSYNGSSWTSPVSLSPTGSYPVLSTNGVDLWALWQAPVGTTSYSQIVSRRTSGGQPTWSATTTPLSDATAVHTYPTAVRQDSEGPLVAWRTSGSPSVVRTYSIVAPVEIMRATPTEGLAPLGVAFASTLPPGSVTSYDWSFGDGVTSTLATPTHIYTKPGQYVARLTVADGSGETQSSRVLITADVPPGSSNMTSNSDEATSYQTQRKIVRASNGTLALIYQKSGTGGLTLAISRDGGQKWFDWATIQTASRWRASAVIAPNNDIYVAYSTNENNASDKWDVGLIKLAYRQATEDWAVASDTFIHDSNGTTGATLAVIERDSAGRLWVAYRFYSGGAYSVVIKYSTDEGLTWVLSTTAEAPTALDDKPNPAIVRLGSNKLGVVWYQNRTFKLRWRADSDPLTSWQAESTAYQITGSQGIAKAAYSVAADAAGRVHILFRDDGLRVVSWDGASWNTPGVVIEPAVEAVYPSLSTNGSDLWAVYDMQFSKGVSTQITARQYQAATGTWGAALALSDLTTVNTFPTTIHTTTGGTLVAWTRGTGPYVIGTAVVGPIP